MLVQRELFVDLFHNNELLELKGHVLRNFVLNHKNQILLNQINSDFNETCVGMVSYYDEMKSKKLCSLNLGDFGNNQQHLFLLISDKERVDSYVVVLGVKLTKIHKDGTFLLEVINYPYSEDDRDHLPRMNKNFQEYYEGNYTLSSLGKRIADLFSGKILILNLEKSVEDEIGITTQECCL